MKDLVQNGNAVTYMFISYRVNPFLFQLIFSFRGSGLTLIFPFFSKASLHY